MPPSVIASPPLSSPTEDRATLGRRKRTRKEDEDVVEEEEHAERAAKRVTRRKAELTTEQSREDAEVSKHETSPSDVTEVAELRRPRVTRARCNVLPEFVEREEKEEEAHRPVTRASSKKKKEQELEDKKRGIVRSTRRRGRDAAAVNRELFRLPTLADLTRVTRSSSRKKPPRPAPVAHPASASGCCDSGEETEREEDIPDASTPEPVVVHEVRVEAVVDAVFECSDACLCGERGGKDESCDERCAAYSPLPFPGFSPPLCADGDELAFGFTFDAP